MKLKVCRSFATGFLLAVPFVVFGDPNPYEAEPEWFEGPFRAKVVRVIDADTISVSINLWPGSIQLGHIRVRNIDAPEVRTKCQAEKELGQIAKEWVESKYVINQIVRLDDVVADPFSGRFVADIKRWRSDRWLYLAEELIERDFALPWQPGEADIDWCEIAKIRAKENRD